MTVVAKAETGCAQASTTSRDWTAPTAYSLGFLTLISAFNYLDRSLLGLALPAIKVEMGVSDTTLGLVSGLAFVLFYSLLGVPIAWLADRWSRRNIVAIGFAFWSLMTLLTGWVASIWQSRSSRVTGASGKTSPRRGAGVVTRRARIAIGVGPMCGGRPAIISKSVAPSP